MKTFSAKIFKIGVNPCVVVPDEVLEILFSDAGRNKGPLSVKGKLNGAAYIQTVVKFKNAWRLYINGKMLKDAGLKNGDMAHVEIAFDKIPREISMHPKLSIALGYNAGIRMAFDKLPPFRRKEIIRYINHLKSEEAIDRNIEKVIAHLSGKESFAGRAGLNKANKKGGLKK